MLFKERLTSYLLRTTDTDIVYIDIWSIDTDTNLAICLQLRL